MDLSTTYLGMPLDHPFMCGACPLTGDMDRVRRLEDAGAACLTLPSLFEEEILNEQYRTVQDIEASENTFPEALTYHPHVEEFGAAVSESYLNHIRKVKEAVAVPVIASLNGVSMGKWIEYALGCREAGADALELNMFLLATDTATTAASLETMLTEVVRNVHIAAGIPVAVKLAPFFTSLPNLVRQIERAGAQGVLLFNRFYQPDIDPENLEVDPALRLSDSSELLLRLRWIAILAGNVGLSLGVTGGVHTAVDAVKAVMAGAHGVQMVSALLRRGPEYLQTIREETAAWMERHGYESLRQMQGSMNLKNSPDPGVFGRGNYMRILKGGSKYV